MPVPVAPIFTDTERLSLLWLRACRDSFAWNRGVMPLFESLWALQFAGLDLTRRAEGAALEAAGFGPVEQASTEVAAGAHWRLRSYADRPADAPSVLIVASPIKKSYIWDLAPGFSAVAFCLRHGLRVDLLDWPDPAAGSRNAGLAEYVDAVTTCAQRVQEATGGRAPVLAGHSLGGTVAALAAACDPAAFSGLVLLGAPLCFDPNLSRFRDALVSAIPDDLRDEGDVPGSLLSYASAVASPQSFVWGRWLDAAASARDRRARELHARIDRWALDERSLPARLVRDIVLGLYRDNGFCHGSLHLHGRSISPSELDLPILVVQNTADEVAPPASVEPALRASPGRDISLLSYSGERGVALQHLGLLVGQAAQTEIWPKIVDWIASRGQSKPTLAVA